MDVGCEALGAGTSRSDRPLAAANGRKPHAGQPSGTVHVLDAVALESAMERWGDTVLRLATSRMGSVADAEDVFQTVFMRLLQSRERFTDDEHLKAWLLRVTINCCNDVHRSPWSKRRAELDDATLSTLRASELDEPGREAPDDAFGNRNLEPGDLAAALARLTPPAAHRRAPVLLRRICNRRDSADHRRALRHRPIPPPPRAQGPQDQSRSALMNENDFRKEYERMQHQVRASSDLKERTLAAAERAADRFASSAQPVATASAKRPHRRAGSRSGGVAVARRWGLPAAACLVAAAIVAGGVPMVMGAMDADGHTAISLSDAQQASGFAVRAYASDGSAPLAPGEGGTVAFDRDLGYRFSGGDDYKVSGFFTGCLFHVEGEGISRVQANLTGGALYRVTFEDGPTDPDDPRMGELASWKPTARGTGEYYGGYDFVGSSMRNGESKLSLAKLMGSTIDVSASDDPGIADGTTSFGLWTNEGEPPKTSWATCNPPSSTCSKDRRSPSP